jgi:hypothetical protein
MSSPVTAQPPMRRSLPGLVRVLVASALLVLVVAACGSTGPAATGDGGPSRLLTYERVWPDGNTESVVIWTNGRSEMRHGDFLERLTLTPEQITTLETALAAEIPLDAPDASPRRTLTLRDGTVLAQPRPEPGSVTQLLDVYMDTHSL